MTALPNAAKNALIVGRRPEIMQAVTAGLTAMGWGATGALTREDANTLAAQAGFDVLIIGGGVETDSRAELIATYLRANPHGQVIEHAGPLDHLVARLQRDVPGSEAGRAGGP
jgi:hypothetical protein